MWCASVADPKADDLELVVWRSWESESSDESGNSQAIVKAGKSFSPHVRKHEAQNGGKAGRQWHMEADMKFIRNQKPLTVRLGGNCWTMKLTQENF